VSVPPEPAVSPPSLSRLPLEAVLAGIAFLELGLNRVLSRLIHLEFLQPRSGLTRAIDTVGLFAFQLVSVLAVLVLGAGILRVALYGKEFRPGARASFPFVGAVFLTLAALGICVRLPANLHFHLHLSFLFLVMLMVLATLASHASASVKLGTVFLFGAVVLRLLPAMMARLTQRAPLTSSQSELVAHGIMVLIAVGALWLIPRRGRTRLAAVLTWIVVCAAALLIRRDWETAARVAAYGFGVELPIQPWGQLLCLGALAAAVYTTVRLLLLGGTQRLRGYGLVLLASGGLQLDLPYQLALVALGFLCLTESAVRVDGTPLTREAFDAVVRGAASVVGAQQVTVTGAPGYEVARLSSPVPAGESAGTQPVQVIVSRRGGVIADLQVTVGEAPPRDPPFSIEHRAASGLGPHPAGSRVETDDPAFDRAFAVYDKRGAGAALLDEDTRARFTRHVTGWLGVWPQRGVRYRTSELPAGDDALPSLIAFLRELAARTA
jgi:hypothetical protein